MCLEEVSDEKRVPGRAPSAASSLNATEGSRVFLGVLLELDLGALPLSEK